MGNNNITNIGRLGIGTTSPKHELDVYGDANITGTLYASNVSSNSPLRLQTSGTTKIYIDDSTSNVGIGTITPNEMLDVNGNVSVSGVYTSPAGQNFVIRIG